MFLFLCGRQRANKPSGIPDQLLSYCATLLDFWTGFELLFLVIASRSYAGCHKSQQALNACMRCFLSCAFTSVCACMTRHALHAFKQARPAECTRASSTCAVYLNILNTRASTALHAIPYGHCTPVPVQHSTCPELRSTTDLTRSVWDTTIGIAKYRNVTYWSYEASKR